MTTAAIYVRVSTSGQEANSSLASQEAACREYAATHGYEVVDIYREVHSGAELWQRPRLSELREIVRRRGVDAVICYAIDRLSRDPTHLGVIVSEADYHQVAIHFVSEPLDSSPEGELIRFVKGFAAKIEREKFKDRSRRGKQSRALRGAPLVGAYPPYGYQWLTETRHEKIVKTTLALDPLRAPIVRSLFEDAAAGRSIRHLAADLNARDVPSVKGRPWQTSSVHSLLRNPIYTGTVVAFRHRAIKDATSGKVTKVVRRHADDPEVIETKNAVPAIVSEELFEAVAERFTANKAMASRNHHDPEATLLRGGYAICGHCGGTMYAHTRKPRPGYQYRCVSWQYDPARCRQHTIVAEILDDAVWQRVSAVLRDPDLIARKIEELRANDPTAGDLAGFEREIAKVTKQRDTYLANVGNAPTVEVAGLMMGKVAQLSDELARLEAERDAINARREAWEAAQTALRDLQAGCARVAERLEHAPYERKREALDYLGVRVKVFRQGSPERYVIEAVTATPSGEIVSTIGAGRTR